FQQTIYFIVNDHAKIKFVVVAEVVPIQVACSTNELKFTFSEFSLETSITETISLTNKSNAVAEFEWNKVQQDEQEDVIEINPQKGSIEPFKSKIIEVTFSPGTNTTIEQTFKLDVKGAKEEILLHCFGDMKESKLAFV